MCGIAGVLTNEEIDYKSILQDMNTCLKHRGPDSNGIWFDKNHKIGFCHTRLSIIDTTLNGSQPMLSKSKRFSISFNGEIYNFKELKSELDLDESIFWNSNSDTEVLLQCIDSWGIKKTIKKCIGMFAIAIWDNIENKLFLIRDRLGEKPLFYGWNNNIFYFSSELKAIKHCPLFIPTINRKALSSFFKYKYIPCPLSIYNEIFKLPPASILEISLTNRIPIIEKYWDILEFSHKDSFIGTENDSTIILENLLFNSISKQMVSDVPIGAFLSGGIDSSLIVSLMQSISKTPVKTFTIGFDNKLYNEADSARLIAKHLGTDHNEIIIDSYDVKNFLPKLADIYDEPFSDSSQIPTFFVSQLAKESVTVTLSGDGGDELFGGYNRYVLGNKYINNINKIPYSISKNLGSFLMNFSNIEKSIFYDSLNIFLSKKYKNYNFDEKLYKIGNILRHNSSPFNIYDQLISNADPKNILNNFEYPVQYKFNTNHTTNVIENMMFLDINTYLVDDILHKLDRASMYNSLESRIPFLNHHIVEFAMTLPLNFKIKDGNGKIPLKNILYKYVPKTLLERSKTGFSIPLANYFRTELKDYIYEILSYSNFKKHNLINFSYVSNLLNDHMVKKINKEHQIWDIVVFQNWYNKNF